MKNERKWRERESQRKAERGKERKRYCVSS